MRIAFITPEFTSEDSYSGGLANYLGRMASSLASQGHDVNVFTKSYVANEVIDFRGVHVHRVIPLWDKKMRIDRIDRLAPRSLYAPYQDMKAAWSLWKRWQASHRETPYEAVQLANVLAVGWFFKRLQGIPVTTRLSSYRPAWDSAFGVEMNASVRLRWWLEKRAIENSQNLYAPTQFVADLTKKNYRVKNVRVIESPFHHEEPAVDSSEYDKTCRGNEYVLFFGRQTQMKGVHVLAQSLRTLMTRHQNMHAVFIGNTGKAPDGSCMHDYVQEQLSDFTDRVTIRGSMRHNQLYPIVRGAKVVALPSLIDNLPNTCLEAMALGRTVVATKGTCFEQLIQDKVSGFLCDADNTESLTKSIEIAWAIDDRSRESISRKAVDRIEKLHPDYKIPELLKYFREIS